MTRFIDEQRVTHGVEPICRTLAIAPSSYYAGSNVCYRGGEIPANVEVTTVRLDLI